MLFLIYLVWVVGFYSVIIPFLMHKTKIIHKLFILNEKFHGHSTYYFFGSEVTEEDFIKDDSGKYLEFIKEEIIDNNVACAIICIFHPVLISLYICIYLLSFPLAGCKKTQSFLFQKLNNKTKTMEIDEAKSSYRKITYLQ